jgi:hypothetical protein
MLTWAAAWMIVHDKLDNGLFVAGAMGCDVAIFYYIAQAVRGR